MKRIALSAVCSLATLAQAQDGTILTPPQLEERAAQFIVFVPPEYPAAAGVASAVDVFGEVNAQGELTVSRVTSTSADPHSRRPCGRSHVLPPTARSAPRM